MEPASQSNKIKQLILTLKMLRWLKSESCLETTLNNFQALNSRSSMARVVLGYITREFLKDNKGIIILMKFQVLWAHINRSTKANRF